MLLNVKDFILTESKLLLLWNQPGIRTSSSLWVLCIHLGWWGADLVFAWLLELSILLWNFSAYHMHCMFYQRLGTASTCVLHHSTCCFLLCVLFSALWVTVWHLSWFAYSFVCGQSLLCLLCYLMLFSALSSLPLFWSTSD